jgi:uncharacterized protein YjbI with pentapeptide repeats
MPSCSVRQICHSPQVHANQLFRKQCRNSSSEDARKDVSLANSKHLQVLSWGVEAWNRWRETHPAVTPDLSGADLTGSPSIPWAEEGVTHCWDEMPDFHGVDLAGARLEGAELEETKFDGANLKGAHLRESKFQLASFAGANLDDADLYHANLTEANLEGASLQSTFLRDAFLSWANLRSACLREATLMGAQLIHTNCVEADLEEAKIGQADFSRAVMTGVDLTRAEISRSKLIGADLSHVKMHGALLDCVDMRSANLQWATLRSASLINTDLSEADLSNCLVYGVSAWNLTTDGAVQRDLLITDVGEPCVFVDDIEVAQFVHLLSDNAKIRRIIDTITTKVVLILGRFTPERKEVLDFLRERLRERNWVPIIFDFEKPSTRNFTETVQTLAHLARFIIADITDPRSVPQELQAIKPNRAMRETIQWSRSISCRSGASNTCRGSRPRTSRITSSEGSRRSRHPR